MHLNSKSIFLVSSGSGSILIWCFPGVAELGGGGGPGGPSPPKNLSGRAKVCFGPPPPKILTTGPPKMGSTGQNLCQIASEHPEMGKIFNKARTYLSGDLRL